MVACLVRQRLPFELNSAFIQTAWEISLNLDGNIS
jgi:hypothetical protein